MAWKTIQYLREGAIATITLNRPEMLNPFDETVMDEIGLCLDDVERDDAVEIIVLRGNGRAFSAGSDLKAGGAPFEDPAAFEAVLSKFDSLATRLEDPNRIVIAVVEGLCVAGGLEFVLLCDFVLASDRASFSDGHLNFGLLGGGGVAQRLPRAVGLLHAKDMILTSRFVSAIEALSMGLVSRTVATDQIESELTALVSTLLAKGRDSRRLSKQLLNASRVASLEDGLAQERRTVLEYQTAHPDVREGLSAFREKRKPNFRRAAQ